MSSLKAGQIFICAKGITFTLPRWSAHESISFSVGDVLTVVWVEPDEECAVPWLRKVAVAHARGLTELLEGPLRRSIRDGKHFVGVDPGGV